MEKFLKLLEEIVPGVDFCNCTTLWDSKQLSSFDVLSIVSEIEDEYEIEVSPADLTPENFNSAENLWALVQSKQD